MRIRFDPSQIPIAPDLRFESALWEADVEYVAGIDEAGRGALAGPVTAAAIILPCDPLLATKLSGVQDSKKMTPLQREYWAERLRMTALAWGIGLASQLEIDNLGILPATRLAAQRALDALSVQPHHVLLDYLFLFESPLPQTSLIKGDARSLSIAAASIIAKTTRDAIMRELDQRYPGYGFASHKGYSTKVHRLMIERLGPSPAHRLTFRPLIRK